MRLGELAGKIGGELRGDPEIQIFGVNDLSRATPAQISFLGNSRYLKAALRTQAGAVIVSSTLAGNLVTPLIVTDNPSAAFGAAADLFAPPNTVYPPGAHASAFIGPEASVALSAHIGPNAVIGEGVRIEEEVRVHAGAVIGARSVIGNRCVIHSNAVLRERTVLGKRVIVHAGAVIGSDGFGYEFDGTKHVKIPQTGYVQLDDDVEIGACATIDRGRFDRTWIREGSKIDNLVMIAHNVVIGPHAIIVAQTGISGSASLGAYVTMAGQTAAVGHIAIGDRVTVTGRSAVTKNLPKPGVYRGTPARPYAESMKIEALTARLPEIFKRLRKLEQQIESRE
jgi:UDP-3-O-[3-hydroxymyristoyl] glucosamine N-acyltransferase